MYKYLFGCRLELFYWEVKTEEEVEMSPGPWLPSELWVFVLIKFFSQLNSFKNNLYRNGGSIMEMVMLAVNWRWPPSFPSLSTCTEFSFVFFPLLISVSDWFVASDFTDVEIGVSRSAILQESGFELLRNLAPLFQQFVQNGGIGQQGGKSLPSIWKWMGKNFAAP